MKRFSIFVILPLVLLLSACRTAPSNAPQGSSAQPTQASTALPDKTDPTTQTTKVPNTPIEPSLSLQALLSSRDAYRLGTNVELNGNIRVHLFFVDDWESRWSADDIAQFTTKQITPGLRFLESEAARYQKDLRFTVEQHATAQNAGYELCYDGIISQNAKDQSPTLDIQRHVARQMGYQSAVAMFEDLYQKNDYREIILLFLVNKDGVSYSFSQTGGSFYEPTLEYAVLFQSYYGKDFDPNTVTHSAASLAHELLHLYGAVDYYTPEKIKQLLQPLYPLDIMLLDRIQIDDMNVGDYTAYTVGWKDQPPTVGQASYAHAS